jgi:ribose transport system ATP-binding protein
MSPLLVLATIAAAAIVVAVAVESLDHVWRCRLARGIVFCAGLVYRPRLAEFRGELADLQASPNESGFDYAVGVLFGATVERAGAFAPPLRLENVSKSFGSTTAVKGVTLNVPAGTVTALLGGTGAGKTTLINMLAGLDQLDAGRISYGDLNLTSGRERPQIAFVHHKNPGLFGEMTVAENLAFAQTNRWIVRGRVENREASWALAEIGATVDPTRRVRDLTRLEQSQVAIARAILEDVSLLVLDDPSAFLPQTGVDWFVEAIDRMRRRDIGIIFVSHRVDEVFQIADRVAVLHDGELVLDEAVADSTPERVLHYMMGQTEETPPTPGLAA